MDLTNLLGSLCRVLALDTVAVTLPRLRALIIDNLRALAAAAGLGNVAGLGTAARGPVLSHLPETHDGQATCRRAMSI